MNQTQVTLNPYNPRRDWGPSAMNIAHQASGNFTYELPIGRGKPWLNGLNGVADKLASGWQFNGIISLTTGFPFNPQTGSNRSGDGDTRNPDRPSLNPAFTGPVIIGSPNRWFDPNAFILPSAGTYGNLGRGALTAPGLADVDFSFFKNVQIWERLGLQFRAEFFNVFNRANFGIPNQVVFSGGAISSSAGVITTTTTASR